MTNLHKIAVVVALIAAVGVVFALKTRSSAPAETAAAAADAPAARQQRFEAALSVIN